VRTSALAKIAMNVFQISPRPAPLPAAATQRTQPAPASSQSGGNARTVIDGSQVDLSEAARQLLALHHHEEAGTGIDMARVQALREAIAAGELRIDAGRIADGLIASACELLQPASH